MLSLGWVSWKVLFILFYCVVLNSSLLVLLLTLGLAAPPPCS